MKFNHQKLNKIFAKTCQHKYIQSSVMQIEDSTGTQKWCGAYGNVNPEDQYFIASSTKLFTSSIIFKLIDQGKLKLDQKISSILQSDIMQELHIYKKNDYSNEITIHHLLSHTSGLADYFLGKNPQGESLLKSLTSGKDQGWTYLEAIKLAKDLGAKFKPGEDKKALYSDTNFQLLGMIIEKIYSAKIEDVYNKEIFSPLGLKNTYLYIDPADNKAIQVNYKTEVLKIPKAMSSFKSDGGIVSTSGELMIFLKAFFQGLLFSKDWHKTIYDWLRIFFPFEYGIGVARFKLPRLVSPFKPFPECIGHSGLSGAISYFIPNKNLFITGTVNQISKPGLSHKIMLKLIQNI